MSTSFMTAFLGSRNPRCEVVISGTHQDNVPPDYVVRSQEHVSLGEQQEIDLRIDLVVADRETGRTLCVLDTKYKADDSPSNPDINQVATYALAKNCRHAVLVYPRPPAQPFNVVIGYPGIRVRTLAFPLDGDIEEAGRTFLTELLGGLRQESATEG